MIIKGSFRIVCHHVSHWNQCISELAGKSTGFRKDTKARL
jgi:hypothetical protein